MLHHLPARRDAATAPLERTGPPAVVEGVVLWSIDIEPYPNAHTPLGGCTAFRGETVTDPAEIDAIARRVRGGAR